jgi:DNA-directed RNA polymerase specialized sigma24 family protein
MYQLPSDIDPTANTLIRHKIRRLVVRGAIRGADAPDFAQDLALHAHVASQRFDGTLGNPMSFFASVVDRKTLDLLRRDAVGRRARGYQVRLEDHLADLHTRENPALKLDVGEVLAVVPPSLRWFAWKLAEMTEVEAARELGLTRGQARHRRRQLARHFTAWGLAPESRSATTTSRGGCVNDKYQRRVPTALEGTP